MSPAATGARARPRTTARRARAGRDRRAASRAAADEPGEERRVDSRPPRACPRAAPRATRAAADRAGGPPPAEFASTRRPAQGARTGPYNRRVSFVIGEIPDRDDLAQFPKVARQHELAARGVRVPPGVVLDLATARAVFRA